MKLDSLTTLSHFLRVSCEMGLDVGGVDAKSENLAIQQLNCYDGPTGYIIGH